MHAHHCFPSPIQSKSNKCNPQQCFSCQFQSEINQANGDGIAIGIDPEIEERLSAAEDVASKLEATMLELQEIKDDKPQE